MSQPKPYWSKISVTVPATFESAVSTVLMRLPVQGLWLEPASDTVCLHVFLPETIVVDEVLRVLHLALSSFIPSENIGIANECVPEEVWQTAWQAYSVPLQNIGESLQIVPPWIPPSPRSSGKKVITLSPGMAFGTGTHATTRSCLILLESLILSGKHGPLLDVGTGSGLLAIAGVKLGVHRATAVEIDPLALKNAEENARTNRVFSKIRFCETFPRRSRYPIVVANLTTDTLLAVADDLMALVGLGGDLILSGMSEGPHELVLKRYQLRCSLETLLVESGWVTLRFCRRASFQ